MKIAWLLGVIALGLVMWGLVDQGTDVVKPPVQSLVDVGLSRQAKYLGDIHMRIAGELRAGSYKSTGEFAKAMGEYWSKAENQAFRLLDEEEQEKFGEPKQWDPEELADLMEARGHQFYAHVQ